MMREVTSMREVTPMLSQKPVANMNIRATTSLVLILGGVLVSSLCVDSRCSAPAASRLHTSDALEVKSVVSRNVLRRRRDANETITDELNKLVDLITAGETNIVMSSNKDIVIVLGISGSGKSALLQFLFGDNSNLQIITLNGEKLLKNDRIGTGTNSKTLFPELITDENGTVYYDCPGFNDNRNTSFDIAASYFIKKVLNHADRVKIIFTISDTKVRTGVDRHGFISLLEHAGKLIPNIEKYREAVALVVTKVDNIVDYEDEDGRAIYVSDDKKLGNVVEFLSNVTSDLVEKAKTSDTIQNIINLNNAFMTKSGNKITKIALFRRPYIRSGPVGDDKKLLRSKTKLLQVIQENIKYVDSISSDFKLSFSDKSELFLKHYDASVIESTTKKISNIVDFCMNSHMLEYGQSDNMTEFSIQTKRRLTAVSTFIQDQKMVNNYKDFFFYFTVFLKNNFISNDVHDKNIESILVIINTANKITKQNIQFSANIWQLSLKNLEYFMLTVHTWCTYFVDLKNSFYKGNGNVDLSQSYFQSTQSCDSEDGIADLFNKLPWKANEAHSIFKNIQEVNSSFTPKLCSSIIEVLPKSENTLAVKLDKDKIIVTANFIKLSEVEEAIRDKKFKILSLHARYAILIDIDFALTRGQHLSIISPVWQVIDRKTIRLVGLSGDPPRPEQAQYPKTDGVPGLPGGNSGNFVGVGSEIINGDSLDIISRGGTGGGGQQGAVGVAGAHGKFKLENFEEFDCPHGIASATRWSKIEKRLGVTYEQLACTTFSNTYTCNESANGEVGKRGGNGGVGGNGGGHGIISLNIPNSKVTSVYEQGSPGQAGAGGQGGLGGNNLIRKLYMYCSGFSSCCISSDDKKSYITVSASSSGETGHSGTNKKGIDTPLTIPSEVRDLVTAIIIHKKVISNALTQEGKFGQTFALKFYNVLSDNRFDKYFRVTDYVTELSNLLETETNKHKQRIMESLYTRVLSYVTRPQHSDEDSKVLRYIVTTIASQIQNVNKRRMIVEIKAFLKSSKAEIETLNKIKNVQHSFKLKDNFRSQIDEKISSSENIINNYIKNELNIFKDEVKQNIDILVSEVHSLQRVAGLKKEELENKKDELETNILLSKLFQGISLVASLLPVIGQTMSFFSVLSNGVDKTSKSVSNGLLFAGNLANKTAKIGSIFVTKESFQESKTEFPTALSSFKADLNKTLDSIEVERNRNLTNEILSQYEHKYERDKSDQDAVSQVKNAIKNVETKMTQLKSYEENVVSEIKPLLEGMQEQFVKFENGLNGNSRATLNIKDWQIKKILRRVQNYMKQITTGFKVEARFTEMFDEFREVISVMFDLYDKIQIYEEQKELSDFIADLNSPIVTAITVSNEEYNRTLVKLESNIKSSLIIGYYKQALNAVKQYVFPFAEYFVSSDLNSEGETFENLVEKSISNLEVIFKKVQEKGYSLLPNQDTQVFSTNFYSHSTGSKPFQVWNNKSHSNTINEFLSGKEILLNADIRESDKNAIKFTKVELLLKSIHASDQAALDYLLLKYKINMTHLGNNHYKCDSKYFTISGDVQTITYSFEKRLNDSMPLHRNEIYRKLSSGDLLLSPYTMWKLKLLSDSDDFHDLQHFKGKVNLELCGDGTYLNSNHHICDTNLNLFYDSYE